MCLVIFTYKVANKTAVEVLTRISVIHFPDIHWMEVQKH